MIKYLKLLRREIEKYPFVSFVLVGLNLLIFILCLIFPWIYEKGCCGIYQVFECKEYGRILWSVFLHSSAEHIFNNMVIVLFLGSMLERQVGHVLYGLVYLAAGIGSGLFSLLVKWYQFDGAVSIGASGAVFGLDGLLLAMVIFLANRIEIPASRVILVVFLSLYSGFSNSGIDNAGHVGGLVIGFIFGVAICFYIRRK